MDSSSYGENWSGSAQQSNLKLPQGNLLKRRLDSYGRLWRCILRFVTQYRSPTSVPTSVHPWAMACYRQSRPFVSG
jgi:hypothetical protein